MVVMQQLLELPQGRTPLEKGTSLRVLYSQCQRLATLCPTYNVAISSVLQFIPETAVEQLGKAVLPRCSRFDIAGTSSADLAQFQSVGD